MPNHRLLSPARLRPRLARRALAAAHARFARAALTIYLATAAVSVALLLVSLITDQAHEEDQTARRLLLQTDLLAHSLSQRLGLLGEGFHQEAAEVLQRIRAIDGKVPVTTTTVGNSGNSGGIFG